MDIQIDTNGLNSNAALRHRFGVEGMVRVKVNYLRSKRLTKIFINDVAVTSFDQCFHQLALMVSDAILVRDNSDKYKTMIEMAKGSKVNEVC